MKYINFKNLKIKNFLSVGETPVEIKFNKGLNIITGINKDKIDRRNGVGKSTVADALYFCIFGSTLRELKNEHIVNNVTNGKCEVELDFDVITDSIHEEFKIVRLLNPSKCYIFKNDVDITRDTISNTTSYICNLISSTPDVFQNCIIMTLNNTIPFMAKKKIEKRKFIEGILNLKVFSEMLQHVRSELNDVTREFDKECARFEEVSSSLNTYNVQKDNFDKQQAIRVTDLNQRQSNNNKQIKKLRQETVDCFDDSIKKSKEKVDKFRENLKLVESSICKYTSDISQLHTTVEYRKGQYKKLGTKDDSCPVCLRPVSDHDKDAIDEEKEMIKADIQEMIDKITKLKDKFTQATKIKKKLEVAVDKLNKNINQLTLNKAAQSSAQDQATSLEDRNIEIDNDIKVIKEEKNQFTDIVDNTTKKLHDIQQSIDNQKHKLHELDIVRFIVSEEGVKAYIVKKILQLLNGKLAYYLKKMDSNCICVFNEYFEEQIIDEKGKICSYFNFSGAERKNIDLACLFAFMDIRRLQGDVVFNFSIYDELFDSSLDEKGIDLVVDILNERIEKYNESIMVISHRKESIKLATGEIILLQKEKGITTRIVDSIDTES